MTREGIWAPGGHPEHKDPKEQQGVEAGVPEGGDAVLVALKMEDSPRAEGQGGSERPEGTDADPALETP